MNLDVRHLTIEELEAGLPHVRQAPSDAGVVHLIGRRPKVGDREVVEEGDLDCAIGLVGDSWSHRGSARTTDVSPHPDMQLTVMGSRAIALIAQEADRWPLAGDQLFVDLNLSADNLPPGMRLTVGSAAIEVTAQPHTGCGKFVERFGLDATTFVNSPAGKQLRIRGINARVIESGRVRVGDVMRRAPRPPTGQPG